MPYGVVMASGGTAQAAEQLGLHSLAMALTAIAAIQAVVIALTNLVRAPRRLMRPRWGFGLFTIALGLAVIADNLHAALPLAASFPLILAWLSMLLLASWRLWLAIMPARLSELPDSTWFLAPAAFLGAATATADLANGAAEWLLPLALAACLVGVAGYALVLAATALRLYHNGLAGAPLAPWWIAAGCGGLAAATLGTLAPLVTGMLRRLLEALLVLSWAAGTLALVSVLIGCLQYARQRQAGRWAQVWTPVFSTAVYAAGTAACADLLAGAWLQPLAQIGAAATLALWLVNSALAARSMRHHQDARAP